MGLYSDVQINFIILGLSPQFLPMRFLQDQIDRCAFLIVDCRCGNQDSFQSSLIPKQMISSEKVSSVRAMKRSSNLIYFYCEMVQKRFLWDLLRDHVPHTSKGGESWPSKVNISRIVDFKRK